MKIFSEVRPLDIPSHEMRDGAIGVITKWGPHGQYIGKVVKRFGDHLVSLDSTAGRGNGWQGWFETEVCLDKNDDNPYRIRILPVGTKLEI